MESNETGPINLGNPAEFKIIELANKIIKIILEALHYQLHVSLR